MAIRRPASKIVWIALGLGVSVIFASSLFRELRRARQERACAGGELVACSRLCARGHEAACGELERRCAAAVAPACEAVAAAKGARPRRARW